MRESHAECVRVGMSGIGICLKDKNVIFISSTSKYVIGKCFSIRISIQNPLYTCLFEYRTALLKVCTSLLQQIHLVQNRFLV